MGEVISMAGARKNRPVRAIPVEITDERFDRMVANASNQIFFGPESKCRERLKLYVDTEGCHRIEWAIVFPENLARTTVYGLGVVPDTDTMEIRLMAGDPEFFFQDLVGEFDAWE